MCDVCLENKAIKKVMYDDRHSVALCENCYQVLKHFKPQASFDFLGLLMEMRDYVSLLNKMKIAANQTATIKK